MSVLRETWVLSPAQAVFGRAAAAWRDRSEAGLARRLAASAFAARVFNAGIGFATQIALARWMGEREFGIFAYVWVWLLAAGGVASLGLPVAALKLVPDYTARGDLAGLRGFLRGARWLGALPTVAASALAIAAFVVIAPDLGPYGAVTAVALVALPIYVLTDIQTGIARAYDFADLGLAADYVLRPLLLLAFAGALYLAGEPGTALVVMGASGAALAVTALVQGLALGRRLDRLVPAGPARSDWPRWAAVSAPLLTVTAFTLLLGATDILILKLFVGPEEIGVYFAATKIVAIASFVSYGVANTSAHRFAAQVASGDRAALAALAAETVRWTFWPTLAVAAFLSVLATPLMGLFGPGFAGGAPLVWLLALGLVAGAAVGPADRALAMSDHGRAAATIVGLAVLANAWFCILLIPPLGLPGAALATALAFAFRAALLYDAAKRRLGLTMLVGASANVGRTVMTDEAITAEIVTPDEAAALTDAWHDLAAAALEPNVFYGPAMALAGMRRLPDERKARVVIAWRDDGGRRALVGLLPLVPGRGLRLNPLPIRRATAHYGTLSTPLLHPDHADAAWAAMLAALDRSGTHGLLLPHIGAEGPVAAALDRVCAGTGRRRIVLDGHRRALLRSDIPGRDYARATLDPRRRKEADRQRRRLAEDGALAFTVARTEAEVAAALDAFLDLEAAGWKGVAGTALRLAPGADTFIREASRELARTDAFRIATLTLDGRPIAAGLVAVAGRRAFYLKTAYDEGFARFSPGLLLTLDLTAHLLDDPAIDDADSIAVADHPMIDRVWTERFAVESVLVATRPGRGLVLDAAAAGGRGRAAARINHTPRRGPRQR